MFKYRIISVYILTIPGIMGILALYIVSSEQ